MPAGQPVEGKCVEVPSCVDAAQELAGSGGAFVQQASTRPQGHEAAPSFSVPVSRVGAGAEPIVMRALGGNQLQLQKLELVVIAVRGRRMTRPGSTAAIGAFKGATGQPSNQLGHR